MLSVNYHNNTFTYVKLSEQVVPSLFNFKIDNIKKKKKYFWINYFTRTGNFSLSDLLELYLYIRTKFIRKIYFSKYFFIGLGFKMFSIFRKLFVWVGLTHYTILDLPSSLKIYAKKKRIYFICYNKTRLKLFLSIVRKIKKRDIYRGKGLLEIKTYKNFIRMKKIKKKQY